MCLYKTVDACQKKEKIIMIRLICDVCADIPVEIAKVRNIIMMPMTLSVNNSEQKYSAENFDAKEFYDGMRNGNICSTSQINADSYINFFTPYLQNGDDIIYVCLSSGTQVIQA